MCRGGATWKIGVPRYGIEGVPEEPADTKTDAPDTTAEGNEEVQALRQCLEQFDPEDQEYIWLRFILEDDYETISAKVGKSNGAVRVAICRIRQTEFPKLKKCMENKGFE